jgi:hypothetical protein
VCPKRALNCRTRVLVRLGGFDERFPWLARLEDGKQKVAAASAALANLRVVIADYSEAVAAREQIRAEADRIRAIEQQRKERDVHLAQLRDRFMEMYAMTNHQARGKKFERFMNDLFKLYDLDPRAAYDLEHEQIDGAFTFRTDDYILEARWWKDPLEPKHLNDFKVKVESKAKNVLGLLVAVNGFTAGAIERHSTATPLMLLDGLDLMAILEGRIPLDELLLRKRRHAAETGSPMLRASEMVG